MAAILFIDDDPDFRIPIANILQSVGNRVVDFESGKSLDKTLKRERFDIAIVDYLLKDETGLEVAEKISKSAKGKNTKIVMISSHENAKPLAAKFGIKYFLSKPLDPDDLIKKIESLY